METRKWRLVNNENNSLFEYVQKLENQFNIHNIIVTSTLEINVSEGLPICKTVEHTGVDYNPKPRTNKSQIADAAIIIISRKEDGQDLLNKFKEQFLKEMKSAPIPNSTLYFWRGNVSVENEIVDYRIIFELDVERSTDIMYMSKPGRNTVFFGTKGLDGMEFGISSKSPQLRLATLAEVAEFEELEQYYAKEVH